MDFLNTVSLRTYLALRTLRGRRGQGALEYIAIVVGLVALVYVGFKVAGVDIEKKASKFVTCATGGAC